MAVGLVHQARHLPRARRGRGQPGLLRGRQDRARRHPRRHHGLRHVRRDARRSGGRPCRSATRSPRSCCSRPASRRWPPAPSSASRTWARRASPAPARRCRRAAGTGMEIEASRVPQREAGMTPYEIMLSESQERMLLVGAARSRGGGPPHLRQVGARRRRDRPRDRRRPAAACASTGRSWREVPVKALADEAPVYEKPTAPARRGSRALETFDPLDAAGAARFRRGR